MLSYLITFLTLIRSQTIHCSFLEGMDKKLGQITISICALSPFYQSTQSLVSDEKYLHIRPGLSNQLQFAFPHEECGDTNK